MYSLEQLLKFGNLSSNNGSHSTIASLLQHNAQRFAADILLDSGDSSASSSEEELSYSDDESEEDNGFVYGQGALRTDLSLEAVEALRNAVHAALDELEPQLDLEQPVAIAPEPVTVYTTVTKRPFVYDHSSNTRGRPVTATAGAAANPYSVFGSPRPRPRALSRSRPPFRAAPPAAPTSNADRENWRSQLSAARRTSAPQYALTSTREAETKNWRRTEVGTRWTRMENGYKVVKEV
ncbi:hypothetical protein M408DRAFT_330439 [Serendipita vermifera MAFF 305830]|uniref:Uncharacterized protein n=1 Tax=Serendipita vermifera MAFF 305830 TaxID=933852 RepID=A0A0C3AQ21_SERVB|nr:hypothetical protein M408DRAFT_330439 [Serendipita vermifera MAFF 305830]